MITIRTQDRYKLIDVDKLYIHRQTIGTDTTWVLKTLSLYKVDFIEEVLGRYKSEDRALEILDTIQAMLTIPTTVETTSFGYRIFKDDVYEMPKE